MITLDRISCEDVLYFKFMAHVHGCAVFALERDFASLYTLWGELSQNELTNASVLSLPGETLKTDGTNSSIIGSDDVHISS